MIAMANKNGLTDRQRMFVQEYLVDFRATQAAIRSGYSPRTAEQQGAKLLRNAQVQEAVKAAMADLVIRTLADIAFADLGAEASETGGGKSAPRRVNRHLEPPGQGGRHGR
jgi:phage terminase small subunit